MSTLIDEVVKDIVEKAEAKLTPEKEAALARWKEFLKTTRTNDSFMTDVENQMLSTYKTVEPRPVFMQAWDADFPKGRARAEHPEWAAHVKQCLIDWYGEDGKLPVSFKEGGRAEVSWNEYKAWVEAGGGDDWFYETEDEANFYF